MHQHRHAIPLQHYRHSRARPPGIAASTRGASLTLERRRGHSVDGEVLAGQRKIDLLLLRRCFAVWWVGGKSWYIHPCLPGLVFGAESVNIENIVSYIAHKQTQGRTHQQSKTIFVSFSEHNIHTERRGRYQQRAKNAQQPRGRRRELAGFFISCLLRAETWLSRCSVAWTHASPLRGSGFPCDGP